MLTRIPHHPHAALTVFAAVVLLAGCSESPRAAAAEVSAEEVEAILNALRTGPAAFERTVVADIRGVGTPFGDYHLNGRYTELHHRESPRRVRIAVRNAHRPPQFTVTRYDGATFLEFGEAPARRVEGPLRRLLVGMVPVPVRAAGVARVDTTSAGDGARRVRVRFKRADPTRLAGTQARQLLSPEIAHAVRAAEESADLVLGADGALVRLEQRFRVTLDGARLTPAGVPTLGPQGTVRYLISTSLRVVPAPQGPVVRPTATGTVVDENAVEVLPSEPSMPPADRPDPDAAPSGDKRAIVLARRANAALRDVSGFTAALRPSLPGGSGVVRVQVGLQDGLVEAVRTSLGEGAEIISTRGTLFSFDATNACWDGDPSGDRDPSEDIDPFTPWRPGRAPIPLRGARFFAPEPAGRRVRIVAERAEADMPSRVRYTLDRRTGRLLAVEGFLTKGPVTVRPGLTVGPPEPIC